MMAKARVASSSGSQQLRRPPADPEVREKQLVSRAMDLAEQRILDGTASSQEILYFLKLGSAKHQAELDKLREENTLLRAKTEHLEASKVSSEMFDAAIKAMRNYQGQGEPDEYDEY